MQTIDKKDILSIAERTQVSININNGEVDILLGHDDFIFNTYKRNNIKLIGGWYQHHIELNSNFLVSIIKKYEIKIINFIGASKSCSGAIILSKAIIRAKVKTPRMNLFLFSAYTTIKKEIYIKRKIEEKIPGSLKKLWDSEVYSEELVKKMELRRLVDNKYINIFLIYPTKGSYSERILAERIKGENVHHIGLPVYMHNTLYPFWKKVNKDKSIEIYEKKIQKMHKKDYNFYKSMQEYKDYNFHLYSMLTEPTVFQAELTNFISSFKEKE